MFSIIFADWMGIVLFFKFIENAESYFIFYASITY